MNPPSTSGRLHRRGPIALGLTLLLCGSHLPIFALEPIRLSDDGNAFVTGTTGKPFRVWGVNYDHDTHGDHGRLIEDYWDAEWETVRQDFQEIRDLGANVVRIHLQLGRFMNAPDTPNPEALSKLRDLLELAEQTGLHLDVTGLGCYHKADVPAWYDAMDEADRWEVQAAFWSAVARACRDSNAVFCHDLMNEPVIGGDESEGWLSGELGGKHFVQRLTLDRKGRTSHEIAEAWVKKMTAAIRKEDPHRLITVGVIPWATVWPNAKPLFYSPEVARHLDFVSVHFYPKKGEVDRAIEALAVYGIGKPLVIEEMFPLLCSLDEMDEFIRKSAGMVEGWISFYWGRTIEEYRSAEEPGIADAIVAQWLEYFREQAPKMRQP
jgi:hypothetical protein